MKSFRACHGNRRINKYKYLVCWWQWQWEMDRDGGDQRQGQGWSKDMSALGTELFRNGREYGYQLTTDMQETSDICL